MDGVDREALIDRLSTEVSTSDLGAFFLAQGLGVAFNRPSKGWGRKKRVTEALLDAEQEGRLDEVLDAAAERFGIASSATSGGVDSIDANDLLRLIDEKQRESATGHLNRSEIARASGLDESTLSYALETLEAEGLISGASVAEERGPIAGIELTHVGRKRVAEFRPEPRLEESYLDYEVSYLRLPTTGSASRFLFTLTRDGTQISELQFGVTYSLAGELQTPPQDLAQTLGWTYLRGLIHLGRIAEGGRMEKMADSASWGTRSGAAPLPDSELKLCLMQALRRMLRAEPRARSVLSLDVEGVAAVLEESPDRVRELLTELEVEGLIEPRAQTFGHTLADGACRITGTGLAWLNSQESEGTEQTAPAAVGPSTSTEYEKPSEPQRKRVFVSYSHDSEAHKEHVRQLADRLRHEGIEANLDQYHPAPPEGWPRWMEGEITASDFVLVVCTETYFRRVTGSEEEGVGLGSRYEGVLISQDIFESGGRNERFLPVIFSHDDGAFIPRWLRPYTRYNVGSEDGYGDLYRRITDQPGVVPPPIGDLIPMPPRLSTVRDAEEPVARPEPLPDWHVDLAVLWDENEGNVRYGLSWFPGIGFVPISGEDRALDGMGTSPSPDRLPLDTAIVVSYLQGRRLRFEFAGPARPITARLHHLDEIHEPHGKGGGAEHWIEYNLERVGIR